MIARTAGSATTPTATSMPTSMSSSSAAPTNLISSWNWRQSSTISPESIWLNSNKSYSSSFSALSSIPKIATFSSENTQK